MNELWRPPATFERAAPWSRRETWLGAGLAVLLFCVVSALGSWLLLRLEWQGTPWTAVVVALTQLGLLLPPLVIMSRYGNPLRLLGFQKFGWRMVVEVGAMLGLGFCGMILWGLVLYPLGIQAQESIVPLFGEGSEALISAFVVGGAFAPLIEEIVFRGFLFGGMLRFFSPALAILGSSALFAALHFQPYAFPVLFLLGVLLATLYYRTSSLWPPVLMHFAVNALALLQYAALEQGMTLLPLGL